MTNVTSLESCVNVEHPLDHSPHAGFEQPQASLLWTIRRALKRHGYSYLHSRKKGLLTQKDLARRNRFAHKIRKLLPHNFWESGISFYLDGTSFVHKTNPFDQARATKSMAWRKRGEGLSLNCTSKGKKAGMEGKKAGVEGKTAHFLVSIAYGKGVIACDQYFERLTGERFSEYVRLSLYLQEAPMPKLRDSFKMGTQPKTAQSRKERSKRSVHSCSPYRLAVQI